MSVLLIPDLKSPEWEFKKTRPFSDLFNEIQDDKELFHFAIQKKQRFKNFFTNESLRKRPQ